MPTRNGRIVPAIGADRYVSYSVRAPLKTHWRHASCEEYGCAGYRNGWQTIVDTSTVLGQCQYDYLIHDRSRSPKVAKTGLTQWTFSYGPGFTCFKASEHRVKISRPPLMLVTGGDWRGNPRGIPARVHDNAENWVEDFSAQQDRLSRIVARG